MREDVQVMVQMRQEGATLREIAEAVGLSRARVGQLCARELGASDRRPWTQLEDRVVMKIKALRREGWCARHVGQTLTIKASWVTKIAPNSTRRCPHPDHASSLRALTAHQVRRARRMHREGARIATIARKLGVPRGPVAGACRGDTYRDVR